jgi:hypothetical protein
MKKLLAGVAAIGMVLSGGVARRALAGTQDFMLVNQTGADINNLYVSETGKASWEEDVLGKAMLQNGASVPVTFQGRDACVWDMMVKDKDGNSLTWSGINLCDVKTVVLHCGNKACWATFQ